jgi:hypothetical protein
LKSVRVLFAPVFVNVKSKPPSVEASFPPDELLLLLLVLEPPLPLLVELPPLLDEPPPSDAAGIAVVELHAAIKARKRRPADRMPPPTRATSTIFLAVADA